MSPTPILVDKITGISFAISSSESTNSVGVCPPPNPSRTRPLYSKSKYLVSNLPSSPIGTE